MTGGTGRAGETGGSTGVDALVLVAKKTTDTSVTVHCCTHYTDCSHSTHSTQGTHCTRSTTHTITHTTTHTTTRTTTQTTTRTVGSRGDGKGTGRRHEIVGEEAEPIKHHCTACEAGEAGTDDGLKKIGTGVEGGGKGGEVGPGGWGRGCVSMMYSVWKGNRLSSLSSNANLKDLKEYQYAVLLAQ